MPVDTSPRPSSAHRPKNSSGGGVSKALIALIAALLVAALVVVGIWAFGKKDDKPSSDESSTSTSSGDGSAAPAKTPKGMKADKTGVVVGKAGRPELAIFEDFQCPGCKGFEDMLGEGISQRVDEGKLQVTYHPKTFLDNNFPGEHSTRAASAAYCAQDAGKFREYHNTVFKNQPEKEGDGWTDDDLKRFGKDAGIEGDALKTFEKCVDDKTYADYALKSEQYSNELGVTGTPTVYLNGELIDLQQLKSKEEFFSKIDEAGAPKKSDASATK
ncbi:MULTISPECIES: DsbA family protein [Kytococcus]|uniref:DsbA family protein n=1 Tax=Kytococcus TaxID=57499 RepID=UPI0008A29449|nr:MULTISPECIES: DsbA family protein [Kytococcus]OFS14020.1 hypothetical protein HMPREF3099_05030 [Kytococcus sp. HMSC28H12]